MKTAIYKYDKGTYSTPCIDEIPIDTGISLRLQSGTTTINPTIDHEKDIPYTEPVQWETQAKNAVYIFDN